MRIAIDARYLSGTYSGIAKYSEDLLTHMSTQDSENEYFVFIHPSYQRRLRVGENFHVIQYPAPPFSLRTLSRFGKKIANHQCDFLHSLAPIVPMIHAVPSILTVHDLQPFTLEEELAAQQNRRLRHFSGLFHRLTLPRCVNQATWIICVSYATRDQLVSLFPEARSKVIVIYSGVEDVFRKRPESTILQMVTKKLDLPARYVLYVGSTRPNKNLSTMLKAFSQALKEHGDELGHLQFLLALGHDAAGSDIPAQARRLGIQDHVRVLGPLTEEEKHVLYNEALVLFSVTRSEGFGLTIVEAQAAGLPVLAADHGSVPEVTDGSALLVDPNDEAAIGSELARLLLDESLMEYLSERGKKNVERFRWERTAKKVYDIYRLLM
ncbi:MAG: glycosyltransferase family 4 protein [Candidatus Sumerlaeota bacterium]